jgi:hypothetical protein
MAKHHFASTPITLAVLAFWNAGAHAGVGRCVPADHGSLICGSGNGAARIIPKTISPSGRLGLAWRVVDGPPTVQPRADDPGLESLIVRIEDGAVLAREHGTYWDIGEKYAPRQYVRATWSPDSQLMIRTVQHANKPDSAELFALAEHDSISLPFELRKILELAVQAEMKGVKDASSYQLKFNYKPDPTIDDQGLIHASVYMEANESESTPPYELTVQATRVGSSFDAKVISISQHRGPYISVTVH